MVSMKFLLFSALLAFAAATKVQQCPGKSFKDLSKNVQIESCSKPPCLLVKGTTPEFKITFTPETDQQELVTKVMAYVSGIPLPFLGVDGSSACDKLQTEDGETASCPLKAGTKYVYKNAFPIMEIYPVGIREVHWALTSEGKDIICFKVKVNIV